MNWFAETLWEQLLPLAPGLSVEVVAEADSTNTRLLERARQGDTAPCLLVAEAQTAGRGRLGRQWWAAPGASLTFSLGLPLAPVEWSGLSLVVGVTLAEALDPQRQHVGVKWPNDLWLLGSGAAAPRKLGGILIETTALGDPSTPQRYAVIGIGLNITAQSANAEQHPDRFATGYAGVQAFAPEWDAPAVLQRVAQPLLAALRRFEAEGLAPWRGAFDARDLLRGRAVQAGSASGIAVGIDAQGQLRVQAPTGTVSVGSGEVSVRLDPAPMGGAPC